MSSTHSSESLCEQLTPIDAEKKIFFSPEQISQLDPCKIPQHVAMVMDGNRRWARKKHLPSIMGHWEGAEVLTDIVRSAAQLGIKTLTIYAFSTENWNRSKNEVDALMEIINLYLVQKKDLMVNEGIRLGAIGDLSKLPIEVQTNLSETLKATQNGQTINLVLALNYGGRDEIRRVILQILKRHDQKKINSEELTESFIAQYLDTTPWGDPDLLIRTSNELRVSNFLLWQISYTEFYITDVLWPAFKPHDLFQAVLAYQMRQRRLGGG